MSEKRILVFCGNPQGQITHLRGAMLKVLWDRPVRAIPEASAHDLVRLGADHLYAFSFAQATRRFGVAGADLHAVSDSLTTAEYKPFVGVRNPTTKAAEMQTQTALELDELEELIVDTVHEDGTLDLQAAVSVIVLDERSLRAMRNLKNSN